MNTSEFIADHLVRDDLKLARLRANMTQKQVADISKLSMSTISNIENANKSVEYLSILKYLDAIEYEIKIVPKPDYMKDEH